jgi:hypothetical protein
MHKPDGTRKLMDISKCMGWETPSAIRRRNSKHTIGFENIDRFKQSGVSRVVSWKSLID